MVPGLGICKAYFTTINLPLFLIFFLHVDIGKYKVTKINLTKQVYPNLFIQPYCYLIRTDEYFPIVLLFIIGAYVALENKTL